MKIKTGMRVEDKQGVYWYISNVGPGGLTVVADSSLKGLGKSYIKADFVKLFKSAPLTVAERNERVRQKKIAGGKVRYERTVPKRLVKPLDKFIENNT